MNVIYRFYKVNASDINLIKTILESHENIMQVSTVDKTLPKIQVTIAPDFLHDAEAIIQDLQNRFFMQKLAEDPARSQGKY